MGDISKIKTPDGTAYNLKDAEARGGSARDDTKLPLSGGTMTGELKITAGYADRSIKINGGTFAAIMPASTGYAGGLSFKASDGTTTKGSFGFYHSPSDSTKSYHYCGTSYSNPNGTLKAGTFVGALTGNADSATKSGKILYSDSTGARSVTLSEKTDSYDFLTVFLNSVGSGVQCVTVAAGDGYKNAALTLSPTPSQNPAVSFLGCYIGISGTTLSVAYSTAVSVTISTKTVSTSTISDTAGYIIKVIGHKAV
jgi:hypothetical protein